MMTLLYLSKCSLIYFPAGLQPTTLIKMNSFKGIIQGFCQLFRNNYFKEHFWISASVIFLIQISFVTQNICSIIFWKSTMYCPKNTQQHHSLSCFLQMLINQPSKLFAVCRSERPKELNISNTKLLNITYVAWFWGTYMDSRF